MALWKYKHASLIVCIKNCRNSYTERHKKYNEDFKKTLNIFKFVSCMLSAFELTSYLLRKDPGAIANICLTCALE